MAGERSRRSARPRRSPKDDDSDDPEMSAALQLTRLDGGALGDHTKESDRLAKIQEKNRKAQQKYVSQLSSVYIASCMEQQASLNTRAQSHIGQGHTVLLPSLEVGTKVSMVLVQIPRTPQGEDADDGARGVCSRHALCAKRFRTITSVKQISTAVLCRSKISTMQFGSLGLRRTSCKSR